MASGRMAVMEADQITQILARLPVAGSDDYVAKVLEIYEHIAEVYPGARPTATLKVSPPQSVNGFASSTNA